MLRRLLAQAALTLLLVGPAHADRLSGPGRISLSNESWGTVFYVPTELKDYEYHRNADTGERTMKSPLGLVRLTEKGIGLYELTFPTGTMLVEGTASSAKVNFKGKAYEFRSMGNRFFVNMPDDKLEYTFAPHLITIQGKQGTTKIIEQNGDYRVESPAGVYTYQPTPDGGFIAKGGPLIRHPYLYRGALFMEAGVGIFIDFKKLDPESPLFKVIEWQPILEIDAK